MSVADVWNIVRRKRKGLTAGKQQGKVRVDLNFGKSPPEQSLKSTWAKIKVKTKKNDSIKNRKTQTRVDWENGDIVLIKAFSKATRKLVGEGKLSTIKIKNTADYKEILRIIKEGRPREIMVA